MSESIDWQTLYPGEEVHLPDIDKTIRVYPIGVAHLNQFAAEIAAIFDAVKGVNVAGADSSSLGAALATAALPVLTGRGAALLSACCNPSLEGAPAFVVAAVVPAWFRQSFGGDRANPFKAVADELVKKISGGLSLSALLSKFSSAPATTPMPSSTADNADSTAASSLTADGPGDSSSIG